MEHRRDHAKMDTVTEIREGREGKRNEDEGKGRERKREKERESSFLYLPSQKRMKKGRKNKMAARL